MVSRRRHDDRDIRRRAPKREPKFRILVVCEGRVTEPGYFRKFQHHMRNPRVHVEPPDEPGVPLTVVQTAARLFREAATEAKKQRDDNIRFDSAWAVFDVDEHPNLSGACSLAEQEHIQLAISNPCFELWALLHFQDQRAHIERGDARSALKAHIREYEKSLPFDRLRDNYQTAVTRAESLDNEAEHHDDRGRNPSTTVYKLTELIRTQ